MRDGWVWTDEESTSEVMVLGWDDDDEEEWDDDLDWDEEDDEEEDEDWEEEEEEDWEEWEEEFEDDEDEEPFGRKKSSRPKWD